MPAISENNFLEKYVVRGIWTIAGLSLGVNSYLVKEKVSEISENLKYLAANMQAVQVQQAVIQKQMENIQEKAQGYNERILYLEGSIHELRGKIGR